MSVSIWFHFKVLRLWVRAVAFWACVGLPVGLPLVNHPNKVLGVELPGGHVCPHGFEHMAQLRS